MDVMQFVGLGLTLLVVDAILVVCMSEKRTGQTWHSTGDQVDGIVHAVLPAVPSRQDDFCTDMFRL